MDADDCITAFRLLCFYFLFFFCIIIIKGVRNRFYRRHSHTSGDATRKRVASHRTGGGSVAFELSAASLPPKRRCLFSLPCDEGREPPSIVRQQQHRPGRLDASIIFCRVLICMSMRTPPLLASPDDDATGGKTPMRKRKTQPFPPPYLYTQ